MKEYNIAISASISYSPFAKVMIASFYKLHPMAKVNLYIFYLEPSIKDLEKDFNSIANRHNEANKIEFVKVEYEQLKSVDNKKGWALDLWCRWYLLDYLVNVCDRVLILGVDTLIRGNLEDFYFQNLDGYYFAAAPDMYINNTKSENWPQIKIEMDTQGLKSSSNYINGDVVLINLNETKGNLSFSNFLRLFEINQFTCWDQDIITYCFNDKIKFQEYLLYNYFPNLNIDEVSDFKFFNNAKIVHFAGGPKPWNISICLANKYFGIPIWWEFAREVKLSDIEYPRIFCFFNTLNAFFKFRVKKLFDFIKF